MNKPFLFSPAVPRFPSSATRGRSFREVQPSFKIPGTAGHRGKDFSKSAFTLFISSLPLWLLPYLFLKKLLLSMVQGGLTEVPTVTETGSLTKSSHPSSSAAVLRRVTCSQLVLSCFQQLYISLHWDLDPGADGGWGCCEVGVSWFLPLLRGTAAAPCS